MNDPAIVQRACPACGATMHRDSSRCWLCNDPTSPSPARSESQNNPPPPIAGPWTFSLSSLMLVMTLIAVCFGLGGIEPGLGIGIAFLVTPAALGTA